MIPACMRWVRLTAAMSAARLAFECGEAGATSW
jgi:hypothetical protein